MAKEKQKDRSPFEQTWEAHLSVMTAPGAYGLKGRITEEGKRNFVVVFGERKKIQRAVYGYLMEVLGKEKALVDFLSGDAVSTIPLLIPNRLRELHLVDNVASLQGQVALDLARRLNLLPFVKHHSIDVTAPSSRFELPSVRTGVFAESGFALPPENRIVSRASFSEITPTIARSAHTLNSSVSLRDVLRVFGGEAGRKLHVIETPRDGASLSVDDWRQYLAGQLVEDSEWQLGDVGMLLEHTGTMRATFEGR